MKSYVVLGFLLIIFIFSCRSISKYNGYNIDHDIHKFKWDNVLCCCRYITEDNAKFWKGDSLGLYGFRRMITPLILKECNIKNRSWQEMEIFFGRPNFILNKYFYNSQDAISLIYLTYLDVENEYEENPINSHKTQYYQLILSKKDSIIINSYLRYQDG
jgi:hypothetical protein